LRVREQRRHADHRGGRKQCRAGTSFHALRIHEGGDTIALTDTHRRRDVGGALLQSESCLNHYRVVRPLGAGGMGEVYEAEDTKLKRRVALKILGADTEADPARRSRFEKEARAVAALNHPNIVTIYSVEECDGTTFLTMELVEGRTLGALIPPHGLPLPELLKYAVPMVEAVAAAHDRGIVHRDLKPGNVMVTSDGRVKVLDFGVAKLADQIVADTSAPTVAGSLTATSVGQVIGTASYMSPEQAQGRHVDHRSDIFSIGILLYELATGLRPFAGETRLDILSSIIKDEPQPLTRARSGIPHRLERVVHACLAKDPAARPQTATELRDRLEALAPAAWHRRAWLVAAAVVAAAAIVATVVSMLETSTPDMSSIGVPTFTRVTDDRGVELWPSLSPDGREVVYEGDAPAGGRHIYLRRLSDSNTTDLSRESPGADMTPVFSPDGRTIAFSSSREGSTGIFVMDRRGESVRRLTNGGSDPVWMPDGREIVYAGESSRDADGREQPSELWAVTLESGQRRRITGTDAIQPRVSPDGRFVAFWALPVDASERQFASPERDIWVLPLGGGPRVRITATESMDWNPAWSPDGRFLYFSSDRGGTMNIWRVAIDRKTGRPLGQPVAMTAPTTYASAMSVGVDGTVAYTAFDYDTLIRSIAFDPISGTVTGTAQNVVTGHRSWLHPDVSPDGRFLTMRSFKGQEDVWVVGVDGTGLRQVTNDPARDRGSRWAPDGSLLYYSSKAGTYQFWTIRPDGSGARQLTHGDLALNYPIPSHDGRWVAATNPNTVEHFLFDAHDWAKPPERLPAPPEKGQVYVRDWSPDDRRLASDDRLTGRVWIFDRSARTWERVGTGRHPHWLPDGRRLVVANCHTISVIDTVTKTSRDVFTEPERCVDAVTLSPDARQIYFTSALTQADIWTMRFPR
jgi:serine/threonine protein kinase